MASEFFDNPFVEDVHNKSVQFDFRDCEVLKKIGRDWDYFYDRFGINDIEYKKENQVEIEFYKLSILGEEFWGFGVKSLCEEIFIGRLFYIEEGKSAFEIVDIGFFDVGEEFAKDLIYLQVAKEGMIAPKENSYSFMETIGREFRKALGVRVGEKRVINSIESEKLRIENGELKVGNEELRKEVLRLKDDFKNLEKKIENAKIQNDLAELEKIEEELQKVSEKVKSVEKKEIKKNRNVEKEDNKDYLIWSGENFKDFRVDFFNVYSFEEAINRVRDKKIENSGFQDKTTIFLKTFITNKLNPRDYEFETDIEFQRRKRIFEIQEVKKKKEFEIEKRKFQEDYKKGHGS